jgi:hypothetical protein
MDSFVASAASVAGRSEVPRQLLEPMPRQLELVEEVNERERRRQRELAGQLVAPVEAVFDLLEQSSDNSPERPGHRKGASIPGVVVWFKADRSLGLTLSLPLARPR